MRARSLSALVTSGVGALALATGFGGGRPVAAGPPPSCPLDVRMALVNSFVAAFNAGRAAAADRLFAKEPDFQWYSARGPRTAARAAPADENRSTLLAYFRKRHRHHERQIPVPNWFQNEYFMTRGADDYPRRLVHGKMDAVCRPGQPPRIIVWSL